MTLTAPPVLWHHTCAHAADLIDVAGVLIPNSHPWLPRPLVWLTDLEDAPPEVLFGFPVTVTCDRTLCRYRVTDLSSVQHWTVYAKRMHHTVRDRLEDLDGAMPMHWWVADRPVPVVAPAVRL